MNSSVINAEHGKPSAYSNTALILDDEDMKSTVIAPSSSTSTKVLRTSTSSRFYCRDLTQENVGKQLVERRELFQRRKTLADFCLVIAVLGVALMILEMECSLNGLDGFSEQSYVIPMLIKCCISASTVLLLCLIVSYHAVNMRMVMIENCIEDSRLVWTTRKLLWVTLELTICAVHPLPVRVEFTWLAPSMATNIPRGSVPSEINDTVPLASKTSRKPAVERVSLDLLLSLPMFLRFYLFCRVLMLHSRLFQDASAQSLGALNRIHFNFRFIFKTLMNSYPEQVLTILITFLFLTFSWSLRVCEANQEQFHNDFFNSMWVVAITFLSVGYGDIVPTTYCGRAIAVVSGMCGAGCTALVVAVLARKLQLSNAEKYVHNFVLEVELNKRLKHAAANVLREAWLAFKCKRISCNKMLSLKHQRQLVGAIRKVRELKNEKRRILDNAVTLVEIHRAQNTSETLLMDLCESIKKLNTEIVGINGKLDKMSSPRC